jgi:hypothetical protein
MRSLLAIAGIFLASCFVAPVSAARADPFIGEWVNWDCGKVMCALTIVKQKKSYLVTFSAFEFGKAATPLCKATIKMKRGPLEFTASYNPPDTLSGAYGGERLAYIEPMSVAELSFVTVGRCKGHAMGGMYAQEGH